MVESDFVYGVDCDEEALAIARDNMVDLELENTMAWLQGVVEGEGPIPTTFRKTSKQQHKQHSRKQQHHPPMGGSSPASKTAATAQREDEDVRPRLFPLRHHCVDTVVCNPPFGTKRAGIDMEFLKVAW
jgi:predicted RNA methylase